MKRIFLLAVLASMLMLSFASAAQICATAETTYVSGLITDQTNGNVSVEGANVTVDCDGNLKNLLSDVNGHYVVNYDPAECDYGDSVNVAASKNSLTGNSASVDWFTSNVTIGCLELTVNVACADVPLIPEFGLTLGITAIVGALVAFFIIRKE